MLRIYAKRKICRSLLLSKKLEKEFEIGYDKTIFSVQNNIFWRFFDCFIKVFLLGRKVKRYDELGKNASWKNV